MTFEQREMLTKLVNERLEERKKARDISKKYYIDDENARDHIIIDKMGDLLKKLELEIEIKGKI